MAAMAGFEVLVNGTSAPELATTKAQARLLLAHVQRRFNAGRE
jgi:hypothetical protein